ncbi:MAG: dihydropteroate synthase [Bacteroidetes bacterium]|nr:dihydropteroate synthase [Bacteroidota bacterium]
MNDTITTEHSVKIGSRILDFSERTYIMGVLNVTPDSFSDGGKFFSTERAVAHALQMIEDGADIIDIGGESTRPKGVYGETAQISAEQELERVLPVIEYLAAKTETLLSIDTTKSAVAEAALSAGAQIVNDISGLRFDPHVAEVAAKHHAALIVMHIQGTPETMQINPQYNDVVAEVKAELEESLRSAESAGVENIFIDPGIGFGKNLRHNLLLLKHLSEFQSLKRPIVIGTSRKKFIGELLHAEVDDRMEGTAASVSAAILHGADIVRVHDVKTMKRVAVIADAIKRA